MSKWFRADGRARFRMAGLLGCAVLLGGCAGKIEGPKAPSVIAPPNGSYALEIYKSDLGKYDAATGAAQLELRNKMVYGIIGEIDYAFYNYEASLFLNEGNFHVGADFAQLGLAAAATISPAARTKTILSALLSGATGLNLSIDKNYFRQQTVQAITSSMEAGRDKVKTTILNQLNKDTTAYPFAAARADLIHYFFAGTLNAGLQQLNQTASADAAVQKTAVAAVQVASFSQVDLACAQSLNTAVFAALAAKDMSVVAKVLQDIGVASPGATPEDILKSYRAAADKAVADTDARARLCAAAKNDGLIK